MEKYAVVRIDPVLADRIRKHVRLLQSKGQPITIKSWVDSACQEKIKGSPTDQEKGKPWWK